MLDLIAQACSVVFDPTTITFIIVGTICGVIFGALPGVSATMAVVIAMTFSYSMDGLPSIAFLVSVYCAAITGGGISAILFSIPGTPSSAVTTLDGYPMAKNGEPGKALGISLICSAIGGIFAACCMVFLTQPLAKAALAFGPAELFATAFLGLSILTCLDSKNTIRTLASGCIGLLLACIGTDPLSGDVRMTWGQPTLVKGISLIPTMVGLFALVEIFKNLQKPREVGESLAMSKLCTVKGLWSMRVTILRSAVLGTFVGILPGAGGIIASFLSYAVEVRCSKDKETFGKGNPRGIAAPETANNAATGGSMVPLLALGIPGSNVAAILATALAVKGVSLGPLLMSTKPVYLYTVFVSEIFTNIIMVFVAIGVAKLFSKILSIPYSILGTLIVLLSVIGAYSNSRVTSDVMLMVIAGILGLAFQSMHFNSAALVLGLVLGKMVEKNFRNAFVLGKGNVVNSLFAGHPIAAVLLVVCAILLFWPAISPLFQKITSKKGARQ